MSEKDPGAVERGRKGGRTRVSRLTPNQLSEDGRHAARARWDRPKTSPVLTDRETLLAMLERAAIPYQDRPECPIDRRLTIGKGMPADASSIAVGDWGYHAPSAPHGTGYNGFWSEFVFSAEGGLLAIWSWE